MKLVVGLGNPGQRYAGTRHNVGFEVVAELARQYGAASPRQRFQGELVEIQLGIEKVWLLCPLTYMNVSGSSVQPARDFFQLDESEILVVSDDISLPVGQLRCRAKGSAGGQKGLADVIRRLGTDAVPRLRIGVGPVPDRWDVADFVLGKFTAEQRVEVDAAVKRAAQAVADWVKHDLAYVMNRYNTKADVDASSKPAKPKPANSKPANNSISSRPAQNDDSPQT
ncbi:MAG: aminoacyl-tRNA hydrolase [Planctomycetales bacterium]|nr:aminoacyl-tRNA hydrolase [Planctomycetales bacterium]